LFFPEGDIFTERLMSDIFMGRWRHPEYRIDISRWRD
jgi:hypothetical protein